jgi:hypothetical protein
MQFNWGVHPIAYLLKGHLQATQDRWLAKKMSVLPIVPHAK